MPSVEWITDVSRLEALEPEWRALETFVHQRTHLVTYDFLATWYRHYAGEYGGAPLIGIARRDSRLTGLAPFVLKRGTLGRIPVVRLELAPSDCPAGEFLIDPDDPGALTALLDSVVTTAKFDVMCLDGFDPASDQLPALRAAAGRHHLPMQLDDHAYAMVDLLSGYKAYYDGLSAHYRRNLQQKARKIAAEGFTVEGVLWSGGLETLDASITRLIAVNEASYKLEGRPLAPHHRAFLRDVATRLAQHGKLSMPILTIGGRDAAFMLGVVERGFFYDITLAYDESFAKVSPGAFLMQQTLERLSEAGVHTVISHGAHEYKRHWSSAFVPQKRVFLFAPTIKASATRVVRFNLQPLLARFRPVEAAG